MRGRRSASATGIRSARSRSINSPMRPATINGKPMDKRALYDGLAAQLAALLDGEPDLVANCANMAALIYHGLPGINWAGFYFARDGVLVLGPFQGKPACVRIGWGQGVCGAAAAQRRALVVP